MCTSLETDDPLSRSVMETGARDREGAGGASFGPPMAPCPYPMTSESGGERVGGSAAAAAAAGLGWNGWGGGGGGGGGK